MWRHTFLPPEPGRGAGATDGMRAAAARSPCCPEPTAACLRPPAVTSSRCRHFSAIRDGSPSRSTTTAAATADFGVSLADSGGVLSFPRGRDCRNSVWFVEGRRTFFLVSRRFLFRARQHVSTHSLWPRASILCGCSPEQFFKVFCSYLPPKPETSLEAEKANLGRKWARGCELM